MFRNSRTRTEGATRRRALVATVAVLGLIVAACGGDDDDDATATPTADSATADTVTTDTATGDTATDSESTTAGTAESDPAPSDIPTGGSITIAHHWNTLNFDPIDVNRPTIQGPIDGIHVFGTLLYSDTKTGELVNDQLESIDSGDGLEWTLTIKPGLEFADGTPYTAEAVQSNWQRQIDGTPELASINAATAAQIASMEVVDDVTLVVTLAEPNGQFPRAIADSGMTFIASPTALEAQGGILRDPAVPVGAGPFIMTEWVPDSRIVLSRNPNYYDAPKPYLDEIVINGVGDDVQRAETFFTGGADIATRGLITDQERAESGGYQVFENLSGGGVLINFNMTTPPFDNENARKAVAYGLDYEGQARDIQNGAAEAMPTFFPEGHPFQFPECPGATYDPEAAQDYLDAYVEETGAPLEFSINTAASFSRSMEFFQSNLAELDGVEMEINVIEPADIMPRIRAGDFIISTAGMPGVVDWESQLASKYETDGAENHRGFSDPQVDEDIRIGRESQDLETRQEAYRDAECRIAEQMPSIWFQTRNIDLMWVSPDLQGVDVYASGGIPKLHEIYLAQ